MKGPREDIGDEIGGLGPALPPAPKPWSDLDERRKVRELQERAGHEVRDGYRIFTGPDGRRVCEKV